jgi:integrase
MPGEGSVFPIRDPATGKVIKWVAQISIGPRTARRYRKRIRPSYAAARDALKALNEERDRGLNPTRATLSAYLEQWVANVRNLRPASIASYQTAIAVHISPLIGDVKLSALSPSHVEDMLTRLDYLSPVTVRKVHGVLRRALSHAVRQRLIPANVAGREFVDPPRIPSREPRALSRDEVRRLLQASEGSRFEALVRVAVGTGLRSGELRALAWEDVELEPGQSPVARVNHESHRGGPGPTAGILHVRHSLRAVPGVTRRASRYVRDELKTERSLRNVPLSPSLIVALTAHREALKAQGFVPTATGPVFPNTRGAPLSDAVLDRAFHELLAAAGIGRLPFRVLRATFATRLFEAGIPDRRVADLLGHSRSRTTHAHYIGAGEGWESALAAVEELLG